MAPSFAPLSSVAIKLLYLLVQDIMSIGPSIYRLVTYTTGSGEHIATALCFLASSLSRNVRLYHIALYLLTYGPHLATHEFRDDVRFRKFRRQLLHSSLARILESLRPGMTTPEVIRFPDGHFRKVIYGLGPYIADYPEQALLACIVQGWCAKYGFPPLTRYEIHC